VKEVIGLSLALVAALIGAYVAWTDDEEPTDSDEAVAIYTADDDDLAKLVWESKEHSVLIERKSDARGDYLWVTAVDRKFPKPKTKDPHTDDEDEDEDEDEEGEEGENEGEGAGAGAGAGAGEEGAEPEPDPDVPIEEKKSSFLANKQGDELFATFAPLEALRELPAKGDDRATFGLVEPSGTITVERKNGPVALTVGGETYGSKDRYVEANEKVWLVDEGLLRPLEFAGTRLIERSLFPTAEKDITKVDVQTPDGTTVTFVQANADDAAKAFWAKAESPETEDAAAGTWLDKVFRLKLREYADESAVTGPLEPVVAYTIHGPDEATRVEIVKAATGEETSWYARSDYNRVLVELTDSLARNVADDVPTLTGN
jgi:hypothetical protein